MTDKKLVFDTIGDAVDDILYYDRKEDEDLPVGAIEEMLESGELTIDEMVDRFRLWLVESLDGGGSGDGGRDG